MTTQQKDLPMQSQSDLVEVKDDNPLATYHSLVASGIDPEKLGPLLDLQERWERNQAERAFARAKVDCKAKLPVVVKDKQGDKGLYASLEHVSRQVDPIAAEFGFAHSYGTKPSANANCVTVTMRVLHKGGHSEELELCDVPYDVAGPKGGATKSPVQGLVSSVSYAQRKLKLMYWDVTVANEDRDGDQPPDTISEDDIGDLNDLIDRAAEAQAATPKAVLEKMLAAYGIDSLAAMPKLHLNDARTRLTKLIHANR